MIKCLVIFFVAVTCIHAAKLPKYIKPCKRSDPNLNKCVIEHGQEGVEIIIDGDRSVGIPKMNPMLIPEVTVNSGGNLKIVVRNILITGLDNIKFEDADVDIEKQHIRFQVYMENVNFVGEYNIDGRILILPIRGDGPANITFVGGNYTFDFDYTLEERGGKKFMNMKDSEIHYFTRRSYYRLENLFGGDSNLGEEMNKFLNENWEEIQKELGPAVTSSMTAIVNTIFQAVFKKFDYDTLFIP